MWFDEFMVSAYDNGMKPAIVEDCHMNPIMLAELQHSGFIHDMMIAKIRDSELVVCDVTGERQNVYFEAGYAKGLGRPVIWTCKIGTHVHFDVNQFNRIEWKNEDDLRQRLAARIKAERTPSRLP